MHVGSRATGGAQELLRGLCPPPIGAQDGRVRGSDLPNDVIGRQSHARWALFASMAPNPGRALSPKEGGRWIWPAHAKIPRSRAGGRETMNQIAPIASLRSLFPRHHPRDGGRRAGPLHRRVLGRRQFLKIAGGAGAGLVLAFSMGGFARRATPRPTRTASGVQRLYPHRAVGRDHPVQQGAGNRPGHQDLVPDDPRRTAGRRLGRCAVEQAPINPAVYGRQSAGGSRSTPTAGIRMRHAGAVARAMLVAAAAKNGAFPNRNSRRERAA